MKKSTKNGVNPYPLLKKYGLNSIKLAKMLGYSSANAFRNSTRHKIILQGIESILEYTLEHTLEYIEKKGDQ